MTAIDPHLIDRTVKRIRRTLDRRFERNPELYVSRQDAYEIKQLLRKNNLSRIKHYFEIRKYSPEILGSIILKNSWLISRFNKYNLNVLSLILTNCDNTILKEYMEDIVMDRSQVHLSFKRLVVPIYCNCLSPVESRQMLDNRQKNRTIVELCLRSVLDGADDADNCYLLLQNYLLKYAYLKDDNLYLLDFSSKSNPFKNRICDILLRSEIMAKEHPPQFWLNALISAGKNCFDRTAAILETLPDRDGKIKILVYDIIGKLPVIDKENKEYYTWGFKALYTLHAHLRYRLILCCGKIMRADPALARRLLDIYEHIGVPETSDMNDIVRKIKEGNISDIVFKTEHDLYREAERRPKGKKKEYVVIQFLKSPNHRDMYAAFLNTYGTRPMGRDFAFDILGMVRHPYLADITLGYFRENNVKGYEQRFLALIKRKQLRSEKIGTYLEENYFDIYTELFGRN